MGVGFKHPNPPGYATYVSSTLLSSSCLKDRQRVKIFVSTTGTHRDDKADGIDFANCVFHSSSKRHDGQLIFIHCIVYRHVTVIVSRQLSPSHTLNKKLTFPQKLLSNPTYISPPPQKFNWPSPGYSNNNKKTIYIYIY